MKPLFNTILFEKARPHAKHVKKATHLNSPGAKVLSGDYCVTNGKKLMGGEDL